MTLDGIYSADQLQAATDSASASSELSKDTFLKLLTTQLQNQDPLNPMENQEFVAQLAQFSSLEQLQGLSDGMESLYLVNLSMNNASLTSLIGKDVIASGDTFNYSGSGMKALHYDASSATTSTTVTITDSDGSVVLEKDLGAVSSGEGSWTWDGKNSQGQTVAEGDYTFSFTGVDANGAEVELEERLHGTIEGMDLESGSPMLTLDGIPLSLSSVLTVNEGDAP